MDAREEQGPIGDGDRAPERSDTPPARSADGPGDRPARAALSAQVDELQAMIRRLESFASSEAKRVSDKLLPQVENKARENIWVSLLLALGLGLVLGIWLTGGRRRD